MSEVRTVSSLALLYAFRMLGLFMVLPVLMLFGQSYDGASTMNLGIALGIYGLTQALFQIPLGLLSDVVGRKPVIVAGLIIFALGSIIAATSSTIEGLILGRALQGSGAIASTIMALVADQTSEQNRTKAMAGIGASIGLSFSLAMMLGPAVAAMGGIESVFWLAAALSGLGLIILLLMVPTPKPQMKHRDTAVSKEIILETLKNAQLGRLNFGIFCLHLILMTMFVSVPALIGENLGLSRSEHWLFYLPILILAFIVMLPFMIIAEKRRKTRTVFLASVCCVAVACFALAGMRSSAAVVVTWVFLFFVAFNLLESMLPSLVSKLAPAGTKGGAMGLYSSCQFLGAFAGGVLGGWLQAAYSHEASFAFSGIVAVVWLGFAWTMQSPRHLSNLCFVVDDAYDTRPLAKIPGVVELFHAVEESTVYVKIDRDLVSETKVREVASASAT